MLFFYAFSESDTTFHGTGKRSGWEARNACLFMTDIFSEIIYDASEMLMYNRN